MASDIIMSSDNILSCTLTRSFDPLSSNSHCGYGPLTFGVPCLSPAAALGGFSSLSRLGSEYFSSSPPGISATYPGISHPALVSSYTNASKDGGSSVPLPPYCPPTDDGGPRSVDVCLAAFVIIVCSSCCVLYSMHDRRRQQDEIA
jgi:hypothetical protein